MIRASRILLLCLVAVVAAEAQVRINLPVRTRSNCQYVVDPAVFNIGSGGSSESITVTVAQGCAWTASESESFISIDSGSSGDGNGTVGFTVASNSGAAREGTLTVAGFTVSVSQAAGSPPDICEDGSADGYVDDTGNNGNAGTKASPWLTLRHGATQTTAGETLCIREGDYTGATNAIDNALATVNSGTSWANAVTIRAYPGETVTLQQTDGLSAIKLQGNVATAEYIIFQDLIIDGTLNTSDAEMVYGSGGTNHIRFQRFEVKNAWIHAFSFSPNNGETTHIEILDSYFHDNGLDPTPACECQLHSIYPNFSDSLIKGNVFWRNYGTPIHLYDDPGTNLLDDNTISHNRIYNNHPIEGAGTGANLDNAGIVLAHGENNKVFNNQIYDNEIGIQLYTNSATNKVYNNTIYRNSTAGLWLQYYSAASDFKNNIIYQNGTNINDLGGTGTHTYSNNLQTDPTFVDAGAIANLRLQMGSAACEAGADTSGDGVTDDFDGTARDVPYDIGAFACA